MPRAAKFASFYISRWRQAQVRGIRVWFPPHAKLSIFLLSCAQSAVPKRVPSAAETGRKAVHRRNKNNGLPILARLTRPILPGRYERARHYRGKNYKLRQPEKCQVFQVSDDWAR
jgi:hypothetical protein